MRQVLKRILSLAFRAIAGPCAWQGITLYCVVLALQFGGVWISVRFITWNRDFYNSLEDMQGQVALYQVGVFGALTAVSVAIFLLGRWLRQNLFMFWRRRLTDRALDAWTENGAYWQLRPGLSPDAIDNPDQRVAEDCRKFIEHLLRESLDLISNAVAIVSYCAVLWSLSGFALKFNLFGHDFTFPRYLFWLAFIYVALSSGITHLLGKPLKSIVFSQERHEADFRHALIQIRESATEIAQSQGEPAERRRLDTRFSAIQQNWQHLIRREVILGLFARPYYQTIMWVPRLFALPAYFAGAVTLGGLMQLAAAFGRVTQTLSWFIFSYKDLAEFAAVADRLDGLFQSAANPTPMSAAPRDLVRSASRDTGLHWSDLQLSTPTGRALHPVPDASVAAGERIWISGPSGQGKTTLLKAISGVWPYGSGRISTPAAAMLFLPQSPRVFAEGMAAAACYPADPAAFDPRTLRAILMQVGLGHRLDGFDKTGTEGTEGLSIGERQRLALARILIQKPDWVLLDESTSALDESAEFDLFALIRTELPDTGLLCVAHRPPHGLKPYRKISIGADQQAEQRKIA